MLPNPPMVRMSARTGQFVAKVEAGSLQKRTKPAKSGHQGMAPVSSTGQALDP